MSKTQSAKEDITEPCTPEGISQWAHTAANMSEGMSISQGVRLMKMIESYGNQQYNQALIDAEERGAFWSDHHEEELLGVDTLHNLKKP